MWEGKKKLFEKTYIKKKSFLSLHIRKKREWKKKKEKEKEKEEAKRLEGEMWLFSNFFFNF